MVGGWMGDSKEEEKEDKNSLSEIKEAGISIVDR